MNHTLVCPIEFNGQTYHSIRLSDYLKTRHQLAFAEVEKLRKKKSPDEDDEDLEAKASVILMASFCEDLPKEAVPDISLDDQVPIGRHIERVTSEYAQRQGGSQPQKKGKPRSIPSSR